MHSRAMNEMQQDLHRVASTKCSKHLMNKMQQAFASRCMQARIVALRITELQILLPSRRRFKAAAMVFTNNIPVVA